MSSQKEARTKLASAKLENNTVSATWWTIFVIVIGLTAITRFYKVTEPDHVCWDETHFGKMGSWYINRTFFFDVHPPLGKMLIALSGYLSGYDGSFAFEKPGDKYENVNFIGMRMFCTFLGACIVPFAYLTVWNFTQSVMCSLLASVLLLFDIGMITLNQYILLDPILLFFVSGSVMGMSKVRILKDRPFSMQWWLWLSITGVMLAGAISVKFVGLFVVLLVGLFTIAELWEILGDLTRPVSWTVKHFLARALTLIVLPAILYTIFFYIHLTVLNRSGNGDGFYSSAFQSRLLGNSLNNASMPRELAYGAVVSLKNHRTGGGYLHSHWHLYPEGFGARQQQITTYSHKDENNKWVVKKYDQEFVDSEQTEFVKSGDLIRLEHLPTRRNLHSHREPAPISKKHLQVTGYGENGTGDANDVWKVVAEGSPDGSILLTVTSKLRFVHYLQHCVLTCSGKQLPKWAYEQQEVSCNPNLRDKNALWNIEDNIFAKLPNVSFEVYAPSFFERFLESHAVMLQGNAGLKPKEGEVTSRPWQWPINYRGQFFSGNSYKIYLLGNPIIWWGNLVILPFSILFILISAAQERRSGSSITSSVERRRVTDASWWSFVAWMLHYLPFWVMGRVLYFHHYFPALYFSSMLSGVALGFLIDSLPFLMPRHHNMLRHVLLASILSGIVYSFIIFSPLTYGINSESSSTDGNNNTMKYLRWLDTWEF